MDHIGNLRRLVIAVTNLKDAGIGNKDALRTCVVDLGGATSNSKGKLTESLLQLLVNGIGDLDVDIIAGQPVHADPGHQVVPNVEVATGPQVGHVNSTGTGSGSQSQQILLRSNTYQNPSAAAQNTRCLKCSELSVGLKDLDDVIEEILTTVSDPNGKYSASDLSFVEEIMVRVKRLGNFYPTKKMKAYFCRHS
jgi:hypothetical protein